MGDPLGSGKGFYHHTLRKISPRFEGRSAQDIERLLGETGVQPEINEDVQLFFNDLLSRIGGGFKNIKRDGTTEHTPLGMLREYINLHYSKLQEGGFVRYGKEKNTEHMILLALESELVRSKIRIRGILTPGDRQKIEEAHVRFCRKIGKKEGVAIPLSCFDKQAAIIFDKDRWVRSFKLEEDPADEEIQHCFAILVQAEIVKRIGLGLKLQKYWIENRKPTSWNWLELLQRIYSIRYLEAKENSEYLKRASKLQKIWGIPGETWRRKCKILSSIDKAD